MLTQTLRSLERDSLVTRPVTPTVPVTVTHELTNLGRSLQDVTRGIKAWAAFDDDDRSQAAATLPDPGMTGRVLVQ